MRSHRHTVARNGSTHSHSDGSAALAFCISANVPHWSTATACVTLKAWSSGGLTSKVMEPWRGRRAAGRSWGHGGVSFKGFVEPDLHFGLCSLSTSWVVLLWHALSPCCASSPQSQSKETNWLRKKQLKQRTRVNDNRKLISTNTSARDYQNSLWCDACKNRC